MLRILDIAAKDLRQLLRDRKTFLFLLIMPIALTLLFGMASGAFSSGGSDSRLPVGFLDKDHSQLSQSLRSLLSKSEVIRLVVDSVDTQDVLETLVAKEKLAAALIVPLGYEHALMNNQQTHLILIGDTDTSVGKSVESEALASLIRLDSSVRTAVVMEQIVGGKTPFNYTFKKALNAWQEPPIRVEELTSSAIQEQPAGIQALAHTSPGMMLQFAIAGLLTCAQILVSERKSRSLQRLLTTNTARVHILLGHFLAIFMLILTQFLLLLSFGQFALRLNYLNAPDATGLMAFCAALAISALGLLIGVVAQSEEQAIIISLVLMFALSGIGGAMVPLEITGRTFQAFGHISPIAWAMDGFKNILLRGLGLQAVLLPCAALTGFGILFFTLAIWRFSTAEEK